jgi:hypothetical protein
VTPIGHTRVEIVSNLLSANVCFRSNTGDASIVAVWADRLCGLVVRVPGYRYRGPGSIF